jgi:hypothetical protein
LNQLHAPLLQLLSVQMATPLLPLSMYSSSAESCLWSWPLLYLVVFAVHFGVHLLFLGQVAATVQQYICVLSLKQFFVFTTLHP